MIAYDFKEKFNIKIRDLNYNLGNLYRYNRKINNQYSIDSISITIVQQRFNLININSILNYQKGLSDNDFFFFKKNSLPISELSKLYLTHSVYNNLDLHKMCYVFYKNLNNPN